MGYNSNIIHLQVGDITLLQTIDPNFQQDIQVGDVFTSFNFSVLFCVSQCNYDDESDVQIEDSLIAGPLKAIWDHDS